MIMTHPENIHMVHENISEGVDEEKLNIMSARQRHFFPILKMLFITTAFFVIHHSQEIG
jgi:hypothetical protein